MEEIYQIQTIGLFKKQEGRDAGPGNPPLQDKQIE
jgi:hypothetical protein